MCHNEECNLYIFQSSGKVFDKRIPLNGQQVKPRLEQWAKCGHRARMLGRHPATAGRKPNRKMAFFDITTFGPALVIANM